MRTRGKAWMGSGVFCSLVFAIGTLASVPAAASNPCGGFFYDNTEPQTLGVGVFTDVRRGPQISQDVSCNLNLVGSVGSAGDMWITMYGTPGSALPTWQCWVMSARVLIKKFDNRKGVGFVTNYDETTKTGLFWGIYDAGNTDNMTLSTFEGGQLKTQLAAKSLGSKIKENVEYVLELDTCEVAGSFNAQFSVILDATGADCGNPDTCITYDALPAGIVAVGAAGIAGHAKNSFVDSQVRVTQITGSGDSEPEP